MQQLFFSTSFRNNRTSFGGSLLKKRAHRTARPLSFKHSIHLILKSSQARGAWSFLQPRNRRIIDRTLTELARRYGVRVIETGNAGNHLHLLLKFPNRACYLAFIRAFSGTIVRRICGASALLERFFDARPFSRIVSGGLRDFTGTRAYVRLNELEGQGFKAKDRKKTWRDLCASMTQIATLSSKRNRALLDRLF